MSDDGTCPVCGNPVEAPLTRAEVDDDVRAPWHFKLMIVSAVVYLVWRFWEIFT